MDPDGFWFSDPEEALEALENTSDKELEDISHIWDTEPPEENVVEIPWKREAVAPSREKRQTTAGTLHPDCGDMEDQEATVIMEVPGRPMTSTTIQAPKIRQESVVVGTVGGQSFVREKHSVEESIVEVAQRLLECGRILFITGAGISVDSGLPTYRGMGGVHEKSSPEGMTIEEFVSSKTLEENPQQLWEHFHEMGRRLVPAKPNLGHKIISYFQKYFGVTVLTQNVDGLHQKAHSFDVIDIHGDFRTLVCTSCLYSEKVTDYGGLPSLPLCPECRSVLRPDVVLFGDFLPSDRLEKLQGEMKRGFDALFVVGTTGTFPYVFDPVVSARNRRIPTVEINTEVTDYTQHVEYYIPGKSSEILDRIWGAYIHERQRVV